MVAQELRDCIPQLKSTWWGNPDGLHIDAWSVITSVPGYQVSLKNRPSIDSVVELYFVNLGGYDNIQFGELHKNVLIVDCSPHKAKLQALKQVQDWHQPHRDYQFEVDEVVNVSDMMCSRRSLYSSRTRLNSYSF